MDSEELNRVLYEAVWAYEAELQSCDLIIRYPYLSGFGLAVDLGAGVLILSPLRQKACRSLKELAPGESDEHFPTPPEKKIQTDPMR